jgi:hypothetical protein
MADEVFRPGETYDNVYLVVIDASGYSSIVRSNPHDRVAYAFDELRERASRGSPRWPASCAPGWRMWAWQAARPSSLSDNAPAGREVPSDPDGRSEVIDLDTALHISSGI